MTSTGDAGEIIVRGKGGPRPTPIADEVGQATCNYLRDGRPSCSNTRICSPSGAAAGFVNGEAIGTIVHRALDRAGLHPAHKVRICCATHWPPDCSKWRITGRNRRAIATSRPQYTQIYAKVD